MPEVFRNIVFKIIVQKTGLRPLHICIHNTYLVALHIVGPQTVCMVLNGMELAGRSSGALRPHVKFRRVGSITEEGC